jgi:SpoVK/Ycf46/Vps4 family AAA+-type ATPase
MTNTHFYRTPTLTDLLPELVRAGLASDRQMVEVITATAIRALRNGSPETALKLSELLGAASAGSASVRWNSSEPPPADGDSGAALVRISSPVGAPTPILPQEVAERIRQFIEERRASGRLLAEGLLPPRSLLLSGPPGTGKTMLAQWIASQLGVKLVALDLASSISSFLGKTGSNLRRSLDFARGQPCVFLLDEFDAIAKRRDDTTEVGELKRIVNVLLKELEDWPIQSVLVAATNHPELLDPAISRRFDVVVQLPSPGPAEREAILRDACGRFANELPPSFLTAVAASTKGASGSALVTMTHTAVRRHVVNQKPLIQAFVVQAREALGEGAALTAFAHSLHEAGGLSVRKTATLLGKSSSTIQYHLKKEHPHGQSIPQKAHPRKR